MLKAGDRVRVWNPRRRGDLGKRGEVAEVYPIHQVATVKFYGEDRRVFTIDELELVEDAMPKYEYKHNKQSRPLTVPAIIEYAPKNCGDFNREFGAFSLWYTRTKQDNASSAVTVAAMVADGKFLWLDWLAENTDMVERVEVKKRLKELTKDDVWVEYRGGNAFVSVRSDGLGVDVLRFAPDGGVVCERDAQNDLFPTDEDGEILIY